MRGFKFLRRFFGNAILLVLCVNISLAYGAETRRGGAQPASSKITPAHNEQFVDGIAAVVDNDVITLRQLSDAIERYKKELKQRNIQIPEEQALKHQVLEGLIMTRVQRHEADRLGIKVTDAQLDRAVQSIATRNKLSPAQLRKEVERSGLEWADYLTSLSEEVRSDMLRQRAVDSTIVITDAEVDAFLREQGRNAAEGRQAAPAQAAAAPLVVDPETRYSLAQILVRVPEGASPEAEAALRAKAEALLAKAKGGADFASLAASSSDGPEALRGGNLGVRPLSAWPDIFAPAIVSLRAGQVSDLIRSGVGFHILKVIGRSKSAANAAPAAQARPPGPDLQAPNTLTAPQGPVEITQTHARHILIKTSTVMSDEQARQRLEQIRQRIVAGSSDFGEMARQYSQDSNAPQGGDLGWLNPGETVPPFEAAMNALAVDEISQPVHSPFGWHLIQVLKRRTHDASDDILRMRARQVLFERRAQPAFENWLEQLRTQAYVDNRLDKEQRLEKNNN